MLLRPCPTPDVISPEIALPGPGLTRPSTPHSPAPALQKETFPTTQTHFVHPAAAAAQAGLHGMRGHVREQVPHLQGPSVQEESG